MFAAVASFFGVHHHHKIHVIGHGGGTEHEHSNSISQHTNHSHSHVPHHCTTVHSHASHVIRGESGCTAATTRESSAVQLGDSGQYSCDSSVQLYSGTEEEGGIPAFGDRVEDIPERVWSAPGKTDRNKTAEMSTACTAGSSGPVLEELEEPTKEAYGELVDV